MDPHRTTSLYYERLSVSFCIAFAFEWSISVQLPVSFAMRTFGMWACSSHACDTDILKMKGLGRQWSQPHCRTSCSCPTILSVMKSLVPLAVFFFSSREFSLVHYHHLFAPSLFLLFDLFIASGIFPVDNYHIPSSRGLACASYFGEAGRCAFPATIAYVSQFL